MASWTLAMAACASAKDASPAESARTGAAASDAASAFPLSDSVAPAAPPGEPASSFPSPSRPVASIVAPRWTNEDARDDAGEFERVAKLASIGMGTRVADIGAGDGYYVVRLAEMVGPTGRVYAEDIVGDYLRLLQDRVRRERLGNVQIARGDAHDPRLPAGDIDVALMIHMYHEIDQPFLQPGDVAQARRPAADPRSRPPHVRPRYAAVAAALRAGRRGIPGAVAFAHRRRGVCRGVRGAAVGVAPDTRRDPGGVDDVTVSGAYGMRMPG
jgi:SAM-dependent methyltransferase